MAARIPREGNDLWPLPRDYLQLTSEGKRLARVNAVLMRESANEDVASWEFFRSYYLNHEEAYFYDNWVTPAPAHYEWTRICHDYDRVVIGAHRGSGKSTIFSDEYTLRDLVMPHTKTLLVNSTIMKIERRFSRLMKQLTRNPRILEDFGNLRPKRAEGLWNRSTLELTNGSILTGVSTNSTDIRGERPHRVIVDDPEHDSKEGTNIDRLIADMETLLFAILIPMLRRGTKLHWIGTTISRKMFLWRIINSEIQDPRLDPRYWFRKLYPGEDGQGNAFWPAENPPEELERKRREWGSRYGPEFLLQPLNDGDTPLVIQEPECVYSIVEGEDPHTAEDPLASQAIVRWTDCTRSLSGEIVRRERTAPFGATVSEMKRIITIDACRTPSTHSDWSVINTLGVDRLNQVWELDLWAGKKRYAQVCDALWPIVLRWRPRVIGVEAHAMEIELYNQIVEQSARFAQANGWVPTIYPIKHKAGVVKEDRIMGLEWRFRRGLIKLPKYLENTHPWSMLFHQIRFFTPDGANLEHDDAVDSLAMVQNLVKGPSKDAAPTPVQEGYDILELLKEGRKTLDGGIPAIIGIPLNKVPETVLHKLMTTPDYRVTPEEKQLNWNSGI